MTGSCGMLAQFGMIDGQRVMSEAAVRIGTSNLLPAGRRGAGDWRRARSGFGAGGRVGMGAEAGIYGWSGAAGTVGMVDMMHGLRSQLFMQFMPPDALYLLTEFQTRAEGRCHGLMENRDVSIRPASPRSPSPARSSTAPTISAAIPDALAALMTGAAPGCCGWTGWTRVLTPDGTLDWGTLADAAPAANWSSSAWTASAAVSPRCRAGAARQRHAGQPGAAGPRWRCSNRPRLATYGGARALVGWHARHRFCAVCGSPRGSPRAAGSAIAPARAAGAEHFPRTDPVTIMLVEHDGKLAARPPAALSGRALFGAGRLRRAGRDDRGSGRARGVRGSRASGCAT